ncbi:hypothetical protein H5T52_11795 [Candidatus Bipolaricaulota bacterium]|nr:hypothetical protein [Candidatus Bipolaricaulota bacterium]
MDLAVPGLPTNPGALVFSDVWDLSSTFSSVFGTLQVWAVSLWGKGVGGGVVLLDSGKIGPDLSYRVWGFRVGGGWRFGSVGLGGQAKILHPEKPRPSLGWALDLGFFWMGPVYLGVLAEALLSSSPYEEAWPFDFSFAAALPWKHANFSGLLGAGVVDLLGFPTRAVAGEIDFGVLSLRGGLRASTLCFGGGVDLPRFSLDWAFTLHPDLPLSFRVSFVLRWP